jgi:hypothetical protein
MSEPVIVGAVHKGNLCTFYEAVNEPAAKELAERLVNGEVPADIDVPIVRTWILGEVEAANLRRRNAVIGDIGGGK